MCKAPRCLIFLIGPVLFAACGSPDLPLAPAAHFPQKWDHETLWKNIEIPGRTGIFNFSYDSLQGTLLATQNGSFSYAKHEIAQNLLQIGELKITGNGGDFSWESKSPTEEVLGLTLHQLHFKGIPVDSAEVKRLTNSEGALWINGQVPEFIFKGNGDIVTGEFFLNAQQARNKSPLFLQAEGIDWSEPTAAYYAGPEKLTPAWRFVLSARTGSIFPTVPTEILLSAVTGEILKSRALAVHFEGSAKMFDENAVASSAAEQSLALPYITITNGQFSLKSDYWQVKNCNRETPVEGGCAPTLTAAATQPTTFTAFPYDSAKNLIVPSSVTTPSEFTKYDELVAYHAVAKAWDWNIATMNVGGLSSSQFTSSWGTSRSTLGLSPSKMLTVYTRSMAKSASGVPTYDNAQYLPGGLSGTGGPAIVIGTGTEEATCLHSLCNIGKDADVTMHEFHHHIIFRSITSTSGESGAMHEGLSDYLTYAITGNNKLAESIVHVSNSKHALRAGNVQGTISQFASQSVHYAGEFWSSVLWDVRNALGQASNGRYKADKIIWDAIDLSVSGETYYGFISAMAKATDAYAQANGDSAVDLRKAMFNVFALRGFLASTSLDGTLPGPGLGISQTGGTPSSSSTVVTTKSSRSGGICGVVANKGQQGDKISIAFLLVTALLPLAFTSRALKQLRKLAPRRSSLFQ